MRDSTESFLTSVLPLEGPYVLCYKQKAAPGMLWKVFTSFKTMEKAAGVHASTGIDSWLCIGSIIDKEYKNPEGKISPRAQKNIKELKSLIFDVDVKLTDASGKHYRTKEDALMGLARFQAALGLPDPTVVDSGYGFHVWWPFTVPVDRVTWLESATLLRAAAGEFDSRLIADPTRVCDASSLLRMPNTLNFKRDEPAETVVLALGKPLPQEDIHEKLHAYVMSKNIPAEQLVVPREKKGKAAQNMLSLFIDEPHDLKVVLKRCNWLKHYVTHQANASEPEWYAALGTVQYLQAKGKSQAEVAQFLSSGHREYTPEATAKKLRQVMKAQDGPTTCDRFRALAASRCEGCPYAAMVNTPVRLDLVDLPASAPVVSEEIVRESGEIVVEQRELLMPPSPYFRGKENGGIYMAIGEGDEAQVRRIYEYDIFPVRRLKDEETDNEMLEISLTLPMDGHRLIKIPNSILTDAKKLTAELANKGVLVHTKEAQNFTGYIIEYARKIQREEKAHEEFARFGWRDVDEGEPRFVLGDWVINTKGDMRKATPAPYLKTVKDVVAVKGNLDAWRNGFDVYTKIPGGEPLKFALMMAFAAPLLALTSFNGLMYNMLGDSGCGKSTALKLMSSVWGKPNEHHLQVHDSRITIFNTIGYLQSIPVTFDELTTIPSDTLADVAYSISEGRGKNRADRSGNTRANTVHWKTVVCGSSNSSLYEKLGMSRSGNNAHAYRIFEALVAPADLQYRPNIDAALAMVEHNYGVAGRHFITYVIKRLPEIRKLIMESAVEFAKRFNMPTAERYWFTLFSCMAVGGKIAKDLGLHNYDIEEIVQWTALQLAKVRETVGGVEGDAFSTLSYFLSINMDATLIIKDLSKPYALDLGHSFRRLNVRYEYKDGTPFEGFIAIAAMKEHCKLLSIEFGWLQKKLQDAKIIKDVTTKSLGEGTAQLVGSTKVWVIDLQHTMMLNRAEKEAA